MTGAAEIEARGAEGDREGGGFLRNINQSITHISSTAQPLPTVKLKLPSDLAVKRKLT